MENPEVRPGIVLDRERLKRLVAESLAWPAYRKGEMGSNAPSSVSPGTAPPMPVRDPRKNPKAGDVFRKGAATVEILCCLGGSFSFRLEGDVSQSPPFTDWDRPWMPPFVKWASDAEVIHAAD